MLRTQRPAGRDGLGDVEIVLSGGPSTGWIRFIRSQQVRYRVAVGERLIAGDGRRGALIGLLVPCIVLAASVTRASDQVSVAVANPVDLTVSAGESVSDGGDCTITNNSSTDTVTITSMTYTLSNPGLFSSTTLTLNGSSQTTSSPGSSNSASFDVSIAPGASVDCTLSADISSSPTNSSAANAVEHRGLYASLLAHGRV